MTWSNPVSRSTGDLITAAIWNQEVVDNSQYLHDRVVDRWLTPLPHAGYSYGQVGDYSGIAIANGTSAHAYFTFDVPDDLATLEGLELLIIPTTTTTAYYTLNSDYGNPTAGEAYNNHSESITNNNQTVTANRLYWWDVRGVFSGLAAGDVCSLRVSPGSTGTFTYLVVGLRMRYTRA